MWRLRVRVVGVYFDGDGAGGARAIARLTLAALRSHRIPARWSHWTGPRLFRFFFFYIRRWAHARAITRTHTRTRFVECVVRIRRTVLYTYVHVNARIPL